MTPGVYMLYQFFAQIAGTQYSISVQDLKDAIIQKDTEKALQLMSAPQSVAPLLNPDSVFEIYEIFILALKYQQKEIVDCIFYDTKLAENLPVLSLVSGSQKGIEIYLIAKSSESLHLLPTIGDTNYETNLLIDIINNSLENLDELLQIPELMAKVNIGCVLTHLNNANAINKILLIPQVRDYIRNNVANVITSAMESKNQRFIKRLLEFTEVMTYIRNNSRAVFEVAVKNNCAETVNDLLKLPEVLAIVGVNHLQLAAGNGFDQIVAQLLKVPTVVANITANNNEALKAAIRNNEPKVVDLLLNFSGVVLALDNNMLHLASHFLQDNENPIEVIKKEKFSLTKFFKEMDLDTFNPRVQAKKVIPTLMFRLFAALKPTRVSELISYNYEYLSRLYDEYQLNHRQVLPRIVSVYDAMKKKGLPTDITDLILKKSDVVPAWGKRYESVAMEKGKALFFQVKEQRNQQADLAMAFVESMFEPASVIDSTSPNSKVR